jgi:predicted kinase
LARALAATPDTVLVSQDAWMAALYPGELVEIADYIRLVPRLQAAMGPHLTDLLRAGLNVVLDWPANTVRTRRWMRGVFEAADAAHVMHVLETPESLSLERLRARNASGEHEFTLTDEQFAELSAYFEPVTAEEGFKVETHRPMLA